MSLTHEDVTEILRIVEASRADEVVLEVEDLRLTVLRQPEAPRDAAAAPARRTEADTRQGPVRVTAPSVGTVRLQASPDEPPFVAVGARIETGQPLCRIDLMGEGVTVPSPTAGTIRIVAAVDGTSVEFGQVLFVIEPDPLGGEQADDE